MRQQWLVFLPMTLATAGLAACASVLGGDEVKVRPIDTLAASSTAPRDTLYESAVAAINERDYGRALDYLQAAKAKDPRNVKALNALGVVYDKLGRFDLSARYYAQASAIEPDSKIVAENMGYSRVLQHLINPNQSVAVATIDLPPDLMKPASPAAATPPAENTAIATAVAPVVPVTERKVIDTVPHVAAAVPFAPPAANQSFASIILPDEAVIERKVVDAPAPTLAATQFVLPDSRPLFASVILSEPVVVERKVIDTTPMMMAMPLRLADAKPFFATAVLPEPALPVTEKRVTDTSPRMVAMAPFILPDVKPLFAASLSPDALAENSASPLSAGSAVTAPAEFVVASTAPVLPQIHARTVSASALTIPAAKLVPATLLSALPAIEPVTEKTVAVPPAVAISIAPLTARPLPAASVPSAIITTSLSQPKVVAAAVPAASVSSSPTKLVVPASVTSVQKNASALPALVAPRSIQVALSPRPASHAAPEVLTSAPVKTQIPAPAMKPVASATPAKMASSLGNKNGKILIGQPIRFFNASGRAGGAGTVLRRLTTLGWTMRASEGHIQPTTVLYYPTQNIAAAKALQRTLPFQVRLVADKSNSGGMRLMVGRDYLSWKPRNARIAALWQKATIIASLQKPSIRGVR